MTITSIFDDLTADGRADEVTARRTAGGGIVVTAGRRPSPVPRPRPEHATAFGQGCLDDADAGRDAGADDHRDAPGDAPDTDSADAPQLGADAPSAAADALDDLVDAARREAEVLGHGRVGTEHLLLAAVRAGGEVGRAFGLRRAGVAVVAAACADAPVAEPLVAPDGTAAPTAVAAAALARARRRAAALRRPAGIADLALTLLDTGRSARLLADLGVDRDDLADVLARDDLVLPAVPAVRADVRREVPAPVPVGVLPPVRLMLPGASDPTSAARTADVTTPLRIGPPPGSPARRLGRGRVEPVVRPDAEPALDLPA
jgi:hypothetical protein